MIISLIGFMGCGKSSVGRELSQLLCCPFIDLDNFIEERDGRTIAEIFVTKGEAGFRQLESQALQDICHPEIPDHPDQSEVTPHLVLALGGGTVMTPQCAELVRKNTLCIYLRASLDTLHERLSSDISIRPLLTTSSLRYPQANYTSQDDAQATSSQDADQSGDSPLRHRIETILSARSTTYENTANIIIDTDGKSIEDIASEISQNVANTPL